MHYRHDINYGGNSSSSNLITNIYRAGFFEWDNLTSLKVTVSLLN